MKKYILGIFLFLFLGVSNTFAYQTTIDGYKFITAQSPCPSGYACVTDLSDNILASYRPTGASSPTNAVYTHQVIKLSNDKYLFSYTYLYDAATRYPQGLSMFDASTETFIKNVDYGTDGLFPPLSSTLAVITPYQIDDTEDFIYLSSFSNNNRYVYSKIDKTTFLPSRTNESGGTNDTLGFGSNSYYLTLLGGDYEQFNQSYTAYEYLIGPAELEVITDGIVINLVNGIEVNGNETNTDFDLNYIITQYDSNNIGVDVDSGYLGTFSGGLNNIQVLNNENFTFQSLGTYDLTLQFTDLNDPLNVITKYYNADYNYNAGYVDPGTISFSFFTSGITFFENGFTLNNFTANPTGGGLYFEIIAPSNTGTGTINLTTEKYYNYGFDTSVKVTYPYHQTAGSYQVRVVYEYQEEKIYPFGTDYNGYDITLAEVDANYDLREELDGAFLCDTDGNGVYDTGESLACPFITLKYYAGKVYSYIDNLKQLLQKIGGAFTNEVNTFSFIPKTHASNIIADSLTQVNEEEYKQTTIGKIDTFAKGFIVFIIFIIGFVVFIGITRSNNG